MSPGPSLAPLVVIGSGYLGTALVAHRPDAVHTSRDPAARPADRRWTRFDAWDRSTWDAIGNVRAPAAIVSFPLRRDALLEPVADLLAAVAPRLLVVGSTSAFGGSGEVDDTSPVDPDDPRAAAEERLRQRGATVLHAAGIYGPGRNPLDWVRRGLIRDLSPRVNLVHVDDLARACLYLLDEFAPGRRCVASDGEPRLWRDIVAWAIGRGYLSAPLPPTRPPGGKRVTPRLLARLGFRLSHPDLFAELDWLETRRG